MKWRTWLAHQLYPQRNYWVAYVVYRPSVGRNVYGSIALVIQGRFNVDAASNFIHQFNGYTREEPIAITAYKRTHWWSDRVPKMRGGQR